MGQVIEELVNAALDVRSRAYSPYSEFSVGAALTTECGKIFAGCNVENASLGLSICAERNAVCQAIAQGQQVFRQIVIAASPLAPPCGTCRQFLFEFGSELDVISVNADQPDQRQQWTIGELLPEGFRLKPPRFNAGNV